MPKSRTRAGFSKRKRHNRLMLEHNRHSQQKLMEGVLKNLANRPENVAKMLNEEENDNQVGTVVVGKDSSMNTTTGN